MSMRDQAVYWGIAAVVLAAILYALGDILLPFVAGAAMAYFLDPAASRLMRLGMPRALAVSILIFGMVGATVTALVLLIPPLVAQAGTLIQTMPEMIGRFHAELAGRFPDFLDDESALRRSADAVAEALRERGMALAEGALGALGSLIAVVLFVVIAPVVTFYLLLDWPRVLERADDLLPRDHAPVIRELLARIDQALAGFVRGQITVCLILAAYYATALGLVGLQFGLVIGVVAGLISFIPWVGAVIGGVLSIGLALFQFWGSPVPIAVVVAIFVLGQFLEGNILVPRLVGGSVGLHPVWLLLAVSVFGALFGFTGMLVAVPVAAATGVLVRFALARYKDSRLYRSGAGSGDSDNSNDNPERRR